MVGQSDGEDAGLGLDAERGRKSLIKVVDPAPRQIPAPDAVARAIDVKGGGG